MPAIEIPALREQLTILVSTGKCKEAIGVNLTHEQVRRLEDKDVIKHYKRYETYVGARTTETLIESFLAFSTKALSLVVKLKDTEALQNELKKDYIITKELSNLSDNIALRCGRLLAVANAFLITAKHVDFSAVAQEEPRHPSRDSDGYTPNANMADHSVVARDELHESEVSQSLMFYFDNASPEKSYFIVDLFCFISLCLRVAVFLNATRKDRNLPPFTSKGK